MMLKTLPLTATLLTLLSSAVLAEEAELNLNDFLYGAELTPSESDFRRFTLTPVMMSDMKQRDMGDIRVFDSNNDLMPSMVRKKDGDIKISKQSLKVFRDKVSGSTKGYILDRSEKHEASLKSLLLKWKKGYAPSVLSITIAHSADKKSWKSLKDIAIVSNVKINKKVLRNNLIEINEHTERYIRLRFLETKKAPPLVAVHAYNTNKKLLEDAWVSSGKLSALQGSPNTYHFSLSEGVSPKYIKLSFGKLNSMISGSLYTLKKVNGKLQRTLALKNFDAYVFSRNNKVIKSRPVNISKWHASEWQIAARTNINLTDENLPGVTVAYPHYEVIFANDGDAPYTAVWGNGSAGKPTTTDITERIKTNNLVWNDIAVVNSGGILNNAELSALMESRQTSWLIVIAAIATFSVAGMFAYRRYQSK